MMKIRSVHDTHRPLTTCCATAPPALGSLLLVILPLRPCALPPFPTRTWPLFSHGPVPALACPVADDCFVAKDPGGKPINALQQHLTNLLSPSTPYFFNTLYDPYRWVEGWGAGVGAGLVGLGWAGLGWDGIGWDGWGAAGGPPPRRWYNRPGCRVLRWGRFAMLPALPALCPSLIREWHLANEARCPLVEPFPAASFPYRGLRHLLALCA